ncbi:primosomal replication protein N [Candidimonas nitroreducens]|uniref:Primosomal replication protein N n=1 Tax=Candidimonas nitroreducens TaxID=683354 RepID=A0A225M4L9_9BURK|nr:primosomal replication protein N [Candidimonas nitroreducens]OWT56285.1 primosomal replication protein N [Candidimonas nitroreducens]
MTATAFEVKPLRYTPAGLPAIEMLLNHESEVMEAGHPRRVELTVPAVALGDVALLLADTPLGAVLSIEGFLAPSRKGSSRLVVHIQQANRTYAGGATVLV